MQQPMTPTFPTVRHVLRFRTLAVVWLEVLTCHAIYHPVTYTIPLHTAGVVLVGTPSQFKVSIV